MALLPQAVALDGNRPLPLLDALRKEMRKPLPDRRKVAEEARQTARQLASTLAGAGQRTLQPAQLRQAIREVVRQNADTWDSAAQLYLALAALHQGLGDLSPQRGNPAMRSALQGLSEPLFFPRGFDSPRRFRPDVFEQRLKNLQTQLAP
jgi:hypothetical protein